MCGASYPHTRPPRCTGLACRRTGFLYILFRKRWLFRLTFLWTQHRHKMLIHPWLMTHVLHSSALPKQTSEITFLQIDIVRISLNTCKTFKYSSLNEDTSTSLK